ncbi:hypothetical protein EU803_15790 [Loktanella sp. IMCC34160]|uniref:GspMb/PilO family protein n=1 Tax=Loktanella sp. IMCC34160 TaxID=2510646 RepID=UPI00101C704F|nr:GspMb/PilO family protein [Loktanella sp. IMCC34160]RYG90073.1 hypothetical protein EU803_15790 [Loktanella sp. IMCC34160]
MTQPRPWSRLILPALLGALLMGCLLSLAAIANKSRTIGGFEVALAQSQALTVTLTDRLQDLNQKGAARLDPSLIWPGSESEVQRDLQRQVLEVISARGLALSRYQDGRGKPGLSQPSVGLLVEVEGDLADLVALLADLEGLRPAVGVSALELRVLSEWEQRNGGTRVRARLDLWGLREAGDD